MSYHRYRIQTAPAPNAADHPNRFRVHVNRFQLAKMLLSELLEYRGDMNLVLSRPCVYGVFSGRLGGFMPRQQHCVGCLRCTVQYPQVVQIQRNPDRLELGDSYFNPDQVDTVLYEAATGRVPVRGAGYGGIFGGTGWDSMWTDMSEIVRPTRDGIHGREFISTAVELGAKPRRLDLSADPSAFHNLRLPIPVLLEPIPLADRRGLEATLAAARRLETLTIVPWEALVAADSMDGAAPIVLPEQIEALLSAEHAFPLVELQAWDQSAYRRLQEALPNSVIGVRCALNEPVLPLAEAGVELIHLVADYHGDSPAGFAMQAVRAVHLQLVESGLREQLSLIGGGGVIAAEHVPKAIISGVDAVAIDTALSVALQGRFTGELRRPGEAAIELPEFEPGWAVQRIVNLVASWRDQLLEVLGAMGLREVQRLRGELGRAMLQDQMELEAFGEIPGYRQP